MTFNLPLTNVQLSELAGQLLPLASSVIYQGGTLHIEPIQREDDREIQAEITDIVIPYIQIVNELPDWSELARQARKAKRLATTQEHDALAAIAAKRGRQVAR